MTKKRKSPLLLLILVVIVTAASLAIAEIALRMLPKSTPLGQLSYETMSGEPVANIQEGIQRGFVVMVPPNQTPRPRGMFAPGHSFYLRYSDRAALKADWMDERGRVLVRINEFGLRERETITPEKPAGQKRIVCLGDSFTFGWGIPEEAGWVRLLEDELRRDGTTGGKDIRTVNCGAAGTVVIDEYWWGLQHRFAKFAPDAVLLTICLNDLIPCSGLFVQGPAPDTGLKLLDMLQGALGKTPLELDPAINWVDLLLHYPEEDGKNGGIYTDTNPHEAMWAQGKPQQALAEMKSWCDERGIRPMVALWPFLQGLGPGRHYPFTKLHELVKQECERIGIPFHDVTPALAGTKCEELWVTPADMHANPTAQRLVLPELAQFVREHGGL